MKRSVRIITIFSAVLIFACLIFQTASIYASDKNYEYKTFWGKWQTKWQKNWKNAGGQDKEGTHFADGKGGFFWKNSKKGPKASVSFSASLPYAPFSVGVSLGVESDGGGGQWVPITDKKSYVKSHMYKLQVKRRVKARPWVTKRHKKGTKKWKEVVKTGYESIVVGKDLRAHAVGKYKK